MDVLTNIIVALHIIGVASLLGGMLVQMKSIKTGTTKILPAIMHGAWTMLATGIILVGLNEMTGDPTAAFHMKIGIKSLVLIAIVVIALINKKKDKLAGWVLPSLMVLTLLNIFLATVWTTRG